MKITRTVSLLLAATSMVAPARMIDIETASDLRELYWNGHQLNAQVLEDIYVTADTSRLGWKSNPIITSPGGVDCQFYTYNSDISMTFDGEGASVHEVFRYGKLEFYYLSDITFKNLHNKFFALAGGAVSGTIGGYGGVLNGTKGGVFTHGGITFCNIGSVSFDNIKFDASQWGTDEFYWLAGAALYTQDGDAVTFTSVNDVTINNVGIRHDSQFILDSGRNFKAQGGAVYTHNMLIENVSRLNISNNYIYKKYQQGTISGFGGAFHLKDDSRFSNIYTANFTGNNVNVANEAQGGAIYLDFESSLTINNRVELLFDGNYVKAEAINDDTLSGTPDIMAMGGAVSLCNEASFIVENNRNVTFNGNYADGTDLSGKSKQELHVAGGALYAGNNASLSFSRNQDVTFSGNSVTANNSQTSTHGLAEGGAIAIGKNSTLVLEQNDDVTFSGNSVKGDVSTIHGGAISAGSGSHISFADNRSVTFSNNSVTGGLGSAIYTEGTLEMSYNDVTFSGNEGYAVYMLTEAKSTSTAHLKMTTGEEDTILFDGDKLYASSTGSTPLSVLIDGKGSVIFRGAGSGAAIENGDVLVNGGSLVLEGGASFQADELKIAAGATLAAAGSGNSVSGTLTMADALSVLSLSVSKENLCTAGQDGTFTGNAVMNMDGTFNLSQNSLTFNVLLNNDVSGSGVYQLLELSTAINKDMWTDSRIHVTGDVLFSDLLWNDERTKLFYARVADEGHIGDRTWTNIAGSGNWNFNARNWKLTGTENNGTYDGILYVNSNDNKPVGVHFTDECTSTADVNITTTVTPRDITVDASRNYTFADAGGTISGTGKLIKDGSGELTIAVNNDFTGGVELKKGTIRVQADKALGKGALTMAENTSLIVENGANVELTADGSQIESVIKVKEGSTLKVDLSRDVSYRAKDETIDGTLLIIGSNKTFGRSSDAYNTAPNLSGNGKYTVQGSNLKGYLGNIADFGGDMEILGENNTLKITYGTYKGSGSFTLNGTGNRLEFIYNSHIDENGTLLPFTLTEGGRLSMSGGSTVKASKVTIGDGAVMVLSGKGNTIETNFDPDILYNNALWLETNATLDMTISAENAISKKNDEAVLNTPFLLTEENIPYNFFVRADMGSAFDENTSYVLMYLNAGVYYYFGDNNEYWNRDMVHVMGDAIYEDLAWVDNNFKLVFNAPDAVIWRDSASTGVWNNDGDKNWKRFTAANASVFYNGDHVRFTDTCTSDSAVSITEEITPGSILVRANRDYTFADGGGTISGTGKLTKQGNGELTIALNNEFTGGVQLDEGSLRLQADKALGNGKLTMAENTSLVVENGTNIELAADGNAVRGNVTIAGNSSLQLSGNDSTYETNSTKVDGSLKFNGDFRSGSTKAMSGSGSIMIEGTVGSTFNITKSEGFTGNIIIQGNGNKLNIMNGGYEGSGMLMTSGNGTEINFEGQNVIIKDSGMLFVNENGKFVAENITLSEYATLVATNTDTIFAPITGVTGLSPMEKYIWDLSQYYVSSGNIETTNFTMEGGTLYIQDRGFHSLDNVAELVFDASNGESFTLSTTFQAYQEGDVLYYLLFTDVAQYSVNGDMIFYVDSEERTEQATLVAVENKFTGKTDLLLRTKAVPEPSAAILSLLALSSLAMRRKRK